MSIRVFCSTVASSDFLLEIRLFGEKVPTSDYKGYPIEVQRQRTLQGVNVSSSFVLAADRRAGILAMTFQNTTPEKKTIPLQFNILGGLQYVKGWGFSRPDTRKLAMVAVVEKQRLIWENEAAGV